MGKIVIRSNEELEAIKKTIGYILEGAELCGQTDIEPIIQILSVQEKLKEYVVGDELPLSEFEVIAFESVSLTANISKENPPIEELLFESDGSVDFGHAGWKPNLSEAITSALKEPDLNYDSRTSLEELQASVQVSPETRLVFTTDDARAMFVLLSVQRLSQQALMGSNTIH